MNKFKLKLSIKHRISKHFISLLCDNMWNVVKDYTRILEDYVNDVQNRNMASARDLSEVFIEKDLRKKFGKEK